MNLKRLLVERPLQLDCSKYGADQHLDLEHKDNHSHAMGRTTLQRRLAASAGEENRGGASEGALPKTSRLQGSREPAARPVFGTPPPRSSTVLHLEAAAHAAVGVLLLRRRMRLRRRLASRDHLRHPRRLRLLPRLRLLAVSARAPMAQLLRVCAERSGLLEAVFAPKLAAAMADVLSADSSLGGAIETYVQTHKVAMMLQLRGEAIRSIFACPARGCPGTCACVGATWHNRGGGGVGAAHGSGRCRPSGRPSMLLHTGRGHGVRPAFVPASSDETNFPPPLPSSLRVHARPSHLLDLQT